MRSTVPIPTLLLVLVAAGVARAEDVILHTNIERTDVNLFLPYGLKTVRGVLINPADKSVGAGTVWGESCRHWGLAHLGLMLENVDQRNSRPKTLKRVIDAALAHFAAQTGHPELVHAPLLFGGMSKGGGWSVELGQEYAARTVAFNNVCGWVGKPDKDVSMPAVIVIGGVPDGFKMLDAIPAQYEPARAKGAPWCLALQWGNAHNYGNANALAFPFLDAVLAKRLPRESNPDSPVKLKEVKIEDGWLGDRGTWKTNYATIACYAEYSGDQRSAAWMPNRYVAHVWRSFVSPDPPVQIVATSVDGRRAIPPFKPTDKRFLIVPSGTPVRLQAEPQPGPAIRKLAFYDGDRCLGESAEPPFILTWTDIPAGPRGVFAEYTTADGKVGVSNPVLILTSGP